MRRSGLLVIAAASVLITGLSVAPARADDDDWQGWRGHEWREHEWREHHHGRPGYYNYGYYYAPPTYYYYSPPVYYAAPAITYGYPYP